MARAARECGVLGNGNGGLHRALLCYGRTEDTYLMVMTTGVSGN